MYRCARPRTSSATTICTRAGRRATGARRRSTSPRTPASGRRSSPSSSARPRSGTTRSSSGARTRWPTGCRPTSTPRRLRSRSTSSPRSRSTRRATRSSSRASCSEVAGVGGDDIGGRLAAIEPQLTWGFRKMFERLETMSDELRRKPSIPNLAAAITLYHVVIEATLAQPGQHFITSYLERRDLLPGLPRGDGERRARRAAPHRLRREAAVGPLPRRTRTASTPWRTCCAR